MILVGVILLILAFALGWMMRDYSWVRAYKTDKVMVVDGKLYKVNLHKESEGE